MINKPSEISLMLDSLKIDTYDLPQNIYSSVIPPPGTYIPVELHHLLSDEFSVFGVHEYRCVAYELEDRLPKWTCGMPAILSIHQWSRTIFQHITGYATCVTR